MSVKFCILFLWRMWDPFYYAFTRLRYIGQKDIDQNVFRVRLCRYKGKCVCLSDGTWIRKNDLLLRIHLHNVRILTELLHIRSDVTRGKRLYQLIKKSMPGLADYFQHHKRNDEIKAIIGITTLNRGCEPLGFETIPISNAFYRCYKRITLMPIHLLSAENPIKSLNKHIPAYLFIPKEKLFNRYLSLPLTDAEATL